MALTKAFTDAVASGDIRGIRIMMKDSLLVDLTFHDCRADCRTHNNCPGSSACNCSPYTANNGSNGGSSKSVIYASSKSAKWSIKATNIQRTNSLLFLIRCKI